MEQSIATEGRTVFMLATWLWQKFLMTRWVSLTAPSFTLKNHFHHPDTNTVIVINVLLHQFEKCLA